MDNNDMLRQTWPIRTTIEPKTLDVAVKKNCGQLCSWEKCNLSVNVDKKEITVNSDKLNLRNYYIRNSKNAAKHAVIF
jgi:hypothetical protein